MSNDIEVFKKGLASPDFAKQLKSVLDGSPVTPEKFQRTAFIAVSNNPDLLGADRATLYNQLLACAADGLLPDNKEATIQIYNTKDGNQWIKKAQYMPMVRGLYKKIRMDERVDNIYAEVVYDKDHFKYKKGTEPFIDHEPCLFEDRGAVIGAYCVVIWKDSKVPTIEWMPTSELNKARDCSKGYKYKDGNINKGNPWHKWPDEMRKKSVVHRLEKSIGTSPEVSKFFSKDMKMMLAKDKIIDLSIEQQDHGHGSPAKNISDIVRKAKAQALAIEDKSQDETGLEFLDQQPVKKEPVEIVTKYKGDQQPVKQDQEICPACNDKGIIEDDAGNKEPCTACQPPVKNTNPMHQGSLLNESVE